MSSSNANAFALTFSFASSHTDNPSKSKRECKPMHPDLATIQCKLGQTTLRPDKRAADNSGFKKLAAQWLQEVQFSNGTFVVTGSLRLRNRQLLKPTNRYLQV